MLSARPRVFGGAFADARYIDKAVSPLAYALGNRFPNRCASCHLQLQRAVRRISLAGVKLSCFCERNRGCLLRAVASFAPEHAKANGESQCYDSEPCRH